MDYELYHHGILGMKWGVRRYQPYSVKPRLSGKTGKEIGKARAYAVEQDSSKLKRIQTRQALNESEKITRRTNDILRKTAPHKKRNTTEMSDEQLRKEVNRMLLEQQYDQLKDKEELSNSGRKKVMEILDVSGDVIAIGASLAVIYAMLKKG